MRVTREVMNDGHRAIVEGAARLLRERGMAGTSVADAMTAAGKTHGGFYRHFASKDAMVAEALRAAFDAFMQPLEQASEGAPRKAAVDAYREAYLSEAHRANPGLGCPMPALGSELARAPNEVRSEFSAGVRRVLEQLASTRRGDESHRTAAAARELAMMVGCVMLARACDEDLASRFLEACRGS